MIITTLLTGFRSPLLLLTSSTYLWYISLFNPSPRRTPTLITHRTFLSGCTAVHVLASPRRAALALSVIPAQGTTVAAATATAMVQRRRHFAQTCPIPHLPRHACCLHFSLKQPAIAAICFAAASQSATTPNPKSYGRSVALSRPPELLQTATANQLSTQFQSVQLPFGLLVAPCSRPSVLSNSTANQLSSQLPFDFLLQL